MKKNEKDLVLQILFALALLIECLLIYKCKYNYYSYVRIFTSVILFVFVFSRVGFKRMRLYYYIGLTFCVAADVLTIFLYNSFFYIGMTLFTLAYVAFANIMYRTREIKERKKIPSVLITISVAVILLDLIYYFVPSVTDAVSYIQLGFHVLIVAIILIWSIKGNKRKKGKIPYFVMAAIIIVLANIAYAVDIHVLLRKHPSVDALVVFLHGVYLLVLAKGINDFKNLLDTDTINTETKRQRSRK